MKIAITGSHGVGKTTLIKELQKEDFLKGYCFIQEVARETIVRNKKTPQEMDADDLVEFEIISHNRQALIERNKPKFIADRSLFDYIAYSKWFEETGRITSRELDEIIEGMSHKGAYDLLIYVPIEFKLKTDGVRFEGLEGQKKVDDNIKIILDYISSSNRKVLEVTGTVANRVKQVMNYIRTAQ